MKRQTRHMRLLLLFVGSVAAVVAGAPPRRSHVCIDKFETASGESGLRWDAITDLGQAINGLEVSADAVVAPANAATWPMAEWVAAAHSNHTRITASVRPVSKAAAASFLALPGAMLASAAESAALQVVRGGYDGMQLDWEGLQQGSRVGFESFVRHCAEALKRASAGRVGPAAALSVTLYAPKLVVSDASTYNVSTLSRLADYVFVMGYDMSELGVPMGQGWKHGGPNAPLDALELALRNAHAMGARPGSLILGLPLYGRFYVCDGDDDGVVGGSTGSTSSGGGGGGGGTVALPPSAAHPLCSCAEKNFHKKTLDIMASCATTDSGCTRGYDETSATPWWDCPRGSGSCFPGLPANQSRLHQQGWYENAASIKAKVALAASYSPLVAGVGVWTAHGADGSTAAGNEQVDGLIWDAFRDYVQVSGPFPSWNRSVLTEIDLCHACSYHEIEDGNGAGRARTRRAVRR
jgi:hypothetical protein